MLKEHLYQIFLQWTGSNGRGTANYRAYDPKATRSVIALMKLKYQENQ